MWPGPSRFVGTSFNDHIPAEVSRQLGDSGTNPSQYGHVMVLAHR